MKVNLLPYAMSLISRFQIHLPSLIYWETLCKSVKLNWKWKVFCMYYFCFVVFWVLLYSLCSQCNIILTILIVKFYFYWLPNIHSKRSCYQLDFVNEKLSISQMPAPLSGLHTEPGDHPALVRNPPVRANPGWDLRLRFKPSYSCVIMQGPSLLDHRDSLQETAT